MSHGPGTGTALTRLSDGSHVTADGRYRVVPTGDTRYGRRARRWEVVARRRAAPGHPWVPGPDKPHRVGTLEDARWAIRNHRDGRGWRA